MTNFCAANRCKCQRRHPEVQGDDPTAPAVFASFHQRRFLAELLEFIRFPSVTPVSDDATQLKEITNA